MVSERERSYKGMPSNAHTMTFDGEDNCREKSHVPCMYSFDAMRQILSAIREVRRELNILMVLSLILVGCIEFWWRHYPPLFEWKDASRFADVAVNLLLAYAASWIFFFVADHRERRDEKDKLTARMDKGFLGLFDAFVVFADHVAHTMKKKPRSEWNFTLTDDLVLLADWEEWAREQEEATPWLVADLLIGEGFFEMKEHYYSLKLIGENLPDGIPLELEHINASYVELSEVLFRRGPRKDGRFKYHRLGDLLIGVHL
jgi:hypothetical protein